MSFTRRLRCRVSRLTSLPDFAGDVVRLSDFRGSRHVLLILNRGLL
jgi:hypothetical protein